MILFDIGVYKNTKFKREIRLKVKIFQILFKT